MHDVSFLDDFHTQKKTRSTFKSHKFTQLIQSTLRDVKTEQLVINLCMIRINLLSSFHHKLKTENS